MRGRHTSTPGLSRKEGMVDQRDEHGTEGALGERRHPRVLQNSLREEAEGMECAPGLEKLEWGVGQMEM